MTLKERYAFFIAYFSQHQPTAETELHYTNPFELVVAVVLSAQCTDKRVNLVTPALFQRYPDCYAMSRASFDELFLYIRSVNYPNSKTKHLLGLSQLLCTQFNGEIPATIDELQTLPGVGRKTANVVVSVLFDQAAMAVDTHVFRVAARLGLTKNAKTPLACELQLVKNIPTQHIPRAHHWLILHGRYVCVARKPLCNTCALTDICSYYQKATKKAKLVKPT